jgi:hypothetical protein
MTFKAITSRLDQEKILIAAGAQHIGYGVWKKDGEIVGYHEEVDRDDDRIFYDHFVREDLL